MEVFLEYLRVFVTGGVICAIGQILIDRTKLTPARILVIFLISGMALTAIGIYEPIVKWGGAGASVPISGFGYALAKGAEKAVAEKGLLGAFTGGLTGASGGIGAAIIFGFVTALLFKPGDKS